MRVDAKVYTYVVGMKYPMPGICRRQARRAQPDDHPLRLRRPVRGDAHRGLGARSPPASGSCYDYGGGGGWGDPLDRDPQAVLDDVLDEYVSVAGAERDYGVVLTGSLEDLTLAVVDATDAAHQRRAAA